MCVQTTLPRGTIPEIEREVSRRLALFPHGGLFLGPTHAIQVDTPIQNALALYQAAGSLAARVDDSILSVRGDPATVDAIDLSKLY
jgi:hypothetical protein